MMLVTGAAGLVGSHITRFLERRGEPLRVLVRESSDLTTLEGLGTERCFGNLSDRPSLRRAIRGCSKVFHVAANCKLWSSDPGHMYSVNVEGTSNMLQAASRAAVGRFVYTSFGGTIAPARRQSGYQGVAIESREHDGGLLAIETPGRTLGAPRRAKDG